MNAAKDITRQLDTRRKRLGMSMAVLARRSGLGLATVQRVLRGSGGERFDTLLTLARALGADVRVHVSAPENQVRKEQARSKAKRLVGSALGNAALENQFVTDSVRRRLERETEQALLRSSNLALWA